MKEQDLSRWLEARRRFHLSHAQVQMARELGLNPLKLGSLANHRQEPWKLPLPAFIEELYERRFGRARPAQVLSIEERGRLQRERRQAKKARKHAQRAAPESAGSPDRRQAESGASITTPELPFDDDRDRAGKEREALHD